MAKAKWATLKLHQLLVDQENYRLGPQPTQRAALRAMIEDQGSKLVRLAKDILLMEGISPGEPIWVVPSEKRGQYVVEEGNRRVTALKLLENPALADGTSVARQFKRLGKLYAEKPIREIDARLFDSREDVRPWKRRRHMTAGSGVGLASWKPLAKGRANRDIGLAAPRSLAVVELLQDDESPAWSEIVEALDARWTTVDRVLNAKAFRDLLGVHIDPKTSTVRFENGDGKAGRALLLRILQAMAAPDFEFSDVETAEDRETFVRKFIDGSVKGTAPVNPVDPNVRPEPEPRAPDAPEPKLPPDTAPPPVAPEGGPAPPRPPEADGARKTLAPPSGPRLLTVSGPRLEPLYAECRKLAVRKNENAAALLLRVFIELSSEAFLVQKSVPLPKRLRDKGVKGWDDFKVRLADKIGSVADHLDPSGNGKAFQQARLAVQAAAVGPYAISTLHGFFHNLDLLPDHASIKSTWDGWESYLRELHGALNDPEI